MRKLLLFAIVIACMVSCKGPKTTEIAIEDFNGKAAGFVDQNVTIKGIAKHICQGSGRKLFLANPETTQALVTVFTNENMEPFDKTSAGKTYIVNGIVKVTEVIDEAYLDEWERQVAEQGVKEGTHICSTEQQAAGIEISEQEENPQMKQIAAYREKIAANNGQPIINYHVECTSFTME